MKDFIFLTTYRKHYVKKQIRTSSRIVTAQEFADPIAEGHKPLLFLDRVDLKAPQEDAEEYFERVKKDHTVEIDPKPLDTLLIMKNLQCNSEYQAKICGSNVEEKTTKMVSLPDDMVLQLTTQRADFRDPTMYMPRDLVRAHIVKQRNNLGTNKKINEILEVKTGDSEYMHCIGSLGGMIVRAGKEKHISHRC